MNRGEFINILTDSLAGRVPGYLISEKADYYRKYISEHAEETGKSESDVIEELGPPELIAHTIIDVYEAEHGVYDGERDAGSAKMDSDTEAEEPGRFFHLYTGEGGCIIFSILILILFLAIGSWMVRFIAAYPLLVVALVLLLYLWNENKKKRG